MSMQPTMPERPVNGAPLLEKARWLVLTHAYCPSLDMVVELWEPSAACLIKPLAFQRAFRSWVDFGTGPRGGQTETLATALWNVSPDRLSLGGIRMRPDKPFPIFEDDGKVYKNTYRPPVHVGTGDIKPWEAFIAHLIPSKREREWFCDWLAHRWRNPGIPGISVIMVAANADGPVYGTGRGFLRDIIARLLGRRYVKPIDFDVFTGSSAQGVYTDWAAYALLVTVSESKDTVDSGRWAARRAVYERLKELVDPRAVEKTFHVKGVQAFDGMAFAAYLILSNNRDAVQIPPTESRQMKLQGSITC